VLSTLIVGGGIWFGWRVYGERPAPAPEEPDALERAQPEIFAVLRDKIYFDELYAATVVKLNATFARCCERLDSAVLDGLVLAVSLGVVAISWVSRFCDELVINLGFANVCERLRRSGVRLAALQGAQVQRNLGVIGVALVVFVLLMTWGWSR
jgi:NADH-quinone oxidoreductase subunit L